MTEELKPCPQCGAKTKQRDNIHAFWECIKCEMELYDDYKEWWCYKEIDRLKEIIKKKDEALKKIFDQTIETPMGNGVKSVRLMGRIEIENLAKEALKLTEEGK